MHKRLLSFIKSAEEYSYHETGDTQQLFYDLKDMLERYNDVLQQLIGFYKHDKDEEYEEESGEVERFVNILKREYSVTRQIQIKNVVTDKSLDAKSIKSPSRYSARSSSSSRATISDNNIGQWLPFPPIPPAQCCFAGSKKIGRKVDIIGETLKEGKWEGLSSEGVQKLLAGIVFLIYARNFDGPFLSLSRDRFSKRRN